MNEETKPVIGSNEHLAEIESRISALEAGRGNSGAERGEIEGAREMLLREQIGIGSDLNEQRNRVTALESSVSGLQGTLGTVQTNVGSLQSSVSSLNSRVDAQKAHIESLERVNPAD